jgi:hypothetical protein
VRERAVAVGEHGILAPTVQRIWIDSHTEIPPLSFKPRDFHITPTIRQVLKLLAQPGHLALNMMPLVSDTSRPSFWNTCRELLAARIDPGEWGSRRQRQWDQENREGNVPRP